MAFPDDYRRWQVAGGNAAIVDSHIGLLRQLLVDTTALNIRLMDGVTPGGHSVVMTKDLAESIQSVGSVGEVAYVENQGENDPQNPKRLWRSSVMRSLFEKLADMTDPVNWLVKDGALPKNLRASAELITNLDNAVVSGWYRFVPNGTAGLPGDLPAASTDQYMMLVIRQSSAELTQMIIGRSADGKIWTRSRVAGDFQEWTLATGVTSADLLNYVARAGSTMTGKLTLPVPTNVLAQLNLRSGVSPAAPVDGDVWRDDSNGGLLLRKGGVTKSVLDDDVYGIKQNRILHVRDQKPASTQGGTNVAGTQTRVLNTIVVNTIPGASLLSNQITLPAGRYLVDAEAPGYFCNTHRIALRNVATSEDLLLGMAAFSPQEAGSSQTISRARGILTLTATTVVELRHYTQLAYTTFGLGAATGDSKAAVFSEVIVKRID